MRSVKKLLKKAMVFTLTAAMLVGTPLTASAAPLNSVYSIGDHWGGQWDDGDDSSHTGTITNTATSSDTESGTLKEFETRILGIALDKTHLDMEVGGKHETITATFLMDISDDELENRFAGGKKELENMLAKRIRWEVQNKNGEVDGTTNKTLSIRVTSKGDARTVTLNPRQGTKVGEDMVVRAYIDGSYYFAPVRDENGEIVTNEEGKVVTELKELVDNKTEDRLSAQATVSIKEYTNTLTWADTKTSTGAESTYVKHTVDLGSKLVRDPATANDTITWTSTNTAVATVNANGVVTIKNKLTSDSVSCKIIAMGERKTAKAVREINVEAGTQASKIIITDTESDNGITTKTKTLAKQTVDLGKLGSAAAEGEWTTDSMKVYAKVFAKVKDVVVKKDGNAWVPVTSETAENVKIKLDDKTYKTQQVELLNGAPYMTAKKVGKGSSAEWQVNQKENVNVTDVITWSSNKNNIVTVTPVTGSYTNMKAVGDAIGTANITAKASSGKNAKVAVVVKGTLKELQISGVGKNEVLYTGQTRQLTAIKLPTGSKDGIKWSIDKVTNAKGNGKMAHPNVTINGKGLLTVKNQLNTSRDEYKKATIRLETTKKVKNVKVCEDATIEINLAQSSVNSIKVTDTTTKKPVAAVEYKDQTSNTKQSETKGEKVDIKVPVNHTFVAEVGAGYGCENVDAETLASTLTWTSNNNKVVEMTDFGGGKKITAKAAGTATITVAGIRAISKEQNGVQVLKKADKIKVSFKVIVTQPVTTITMNKPDVTLAYQTQKKGKNEVTKAQNVALKVTLGPKGVASNKETIKWKVEQTAGTMKTEEDDTASIKRLAGNKVNTKANATVVLPKPEVGDEYVVTATASTGVVATSTIKIVKKALAVEMSPSNTKGSDEKPVIFTDSTKNNKKNQKTITIGGDFDIYSWVNVGTNANAGKDWKLAGSVTGVQDVTYSVNKKGIVSVDREGHVVGIGKGTVQITAKTPMGQSKKLTVVVNAE